jgi:hypothetical protein
MNNKYIDTRMVSIAVLMSCLVHELENYVGDFDALRYRHLPLAALKALGIR